MNKKIITAAWLVLTTFVSSIASAAVIHTNSVNDSFGNGQSADSEVVPGGSVRANDVIMVFGAGGDIAAKDEVVIRLPDGLNFTQAPTFKVTPATATTGMLLKDSVGDPTLETAATSLSDTNGDGLNDRASVIVAVGGGWDTKPDTLTVSVHLSAAADLKPSATASKATVVITGKSLSQVDVVKIVKKARTLSAATTSLETAPVTVSNNTGIGTLTATFNITIPAGATNGTTVTLNPDDTVYFLPTTSTLTLKKVIGPAGVGLPITGTVTGGNIAKGFLTTAKSLTGYSNTVTLTVQNAPVRTGVAIDSFPDPVTLEFQISAVATTATTVAKAGNYGLAVAGTAGAKGTVDLVNMSATGSKATAAAKLTKIVTGAKQYQTLPTITISENFNGDAISGSTNATKTITVTAGKGLTFRPSSANITIGGNVVINTGSNNGGTYTASVANFLFSASGGTTKTITIAGLEGLASAEGTLTVTVTGGSAYAPKGDVLNVATGIARGTTSVSYETKVKKVVTKAKVGNKGSATSAVVLRESTYGAITTKNATGATSAYLSFSATNAKVTGVTIAGDSNYTGGTAPTFGTCVAESTGSSTYVCPVTAESSGAFLPGTATITANVTYKADGAIGDVISVAVGGNTDVTGEADVADIVVATESSAGVVPQVTIGSANAQKLAPITIKRSFVGSTVAGYFRLIAPAGVKFANPGNITASVFGGTTATVTASTFATNDTLVIFSAGSPTMTFTPEAIISPDVAAGDISVDIIDGNISGTGKSGVTDESVNVAYAVAEISALSAGKAITIGANYSATNTREGGVGAITAASSNTGVATVAVDGDSITVTGVAAGAATITVTDSLGGTAAIAVTVTAALEQAEAKAGKTLSGADLPTGTAFTAGASSDGGATQATEFTTADDVEIVATVTVGTDIVGEAGAIHVALMAKTDDGTTFSYLDEDGKWADWDITGLPGVHIDADALAASYNVSIYSGKFAAGTYRIALAYSSDGEVYFTGKAITLTVTE